MKIINVAIIGPGLVGSEFVNQILAFSLKPTIPNVSIRIVAICNSKSMILSDIDLGNWKQQLKDSRLPVDLVEISDILSKDYSNGVMVDCTSSQQVSDQYHSWINKKLHIITPNKKAFSGNYQYWKQIFDASIENNVQLMHESTVGAGLPVISTLRDLVNSGDEIIRIEGIFSGTLSFIFNSFSNGSLDASLKFSDVVSEAKAKGYTEPDPRDDLNGLDVARKVSILARICGIPLEISELKVQNIVPKDLQSLNTSLEFMDRLPDYNQYFYKLNQEALEKGCVLRYVGVVDAVNGCSVELRSYEMSHPFASLKGSDNIIAFKTMRFPSPLIIQGAGAGDKVTAFGMFSDLLKIQNSINE